MKHSIASFGLLVLLFLALRFSPAFAASPTSICPSAIANAPAPACSVPVVCKIPTAATDMIRTTDASNVQRWVPYSQLTASSAAVDCSNGSAWKNLGLLGIPVYVPPVVTPPPVTPPATVPVTITPASVDMQPYPAVTYPNAPPGSCWTLSDTIKTQQVCLK